MTGKGRLVPRIGKSVRGLFTYHAARRAGLYEGWFTGRIERIDPQLLLEELTLVCDCGLAMRLSVTTYSAKLLSFTAPLVDTAAAEPLRQERLQKAASASGR
jgi:hypothetical protein